MLKRSRRGVRRRRGVRTGEGGFEDEWNEGCWKAWLAGCDGDVWDDAVTGIGSEFARN